MKQCAVHHHVHVLLQDSVAVVKKFMAMAGGDINFNLIALAPPSPYDG
jgi:hypothetical protein